MSLGGLRPGDRLIFRGGDRCEQGATFIRYAKSKAFENCLVVKLDNRSHRQSWHEDNFEIPQPIMPDNREYYQTITKGE